MKILYIECAMGAAGDMLMAALYEILPDKEAFIKKMNNIGLDGVTLRPLAAKSCSVSGTRMEVLVHGHEEGGGAHHHHHDHSRVSDIKETVRGLDLPEDVKSRVFAVYDRLAAAEAAVHGEPVELVHFHEVGALDAIADIAGVCYAAHLLGEPRVVVSPVHVGSGTVKCAHGVFPVPAPATALLLSEMPCYGGEIRGELCTPTGAALLRELASGCGPMPAMTMKAVGVGLGKKEFESVPNCVRTFLGESPDGANAEISEISCNLDDMSPEALAFACERILELGALDVYTIPGTMKKGRAGHVLTVLCQPEDTDKFARAVLRETSTNGLRVKRCEKYFLKTSQDVVSTSWGEVRIKKAEGFSVTRLKPEYDDVAKLARENDLPFNTLWQAAMDAARKL